MYNVTEDCLFDIHGGQIWFLKQFDREIMLNLWEQVKVLCGDALSAQICSPAWSQCSAVQIKGDGCILVALTHETFLFFSRWIAEAEIVPNPGTDSTQALPSPSYQGIKTALNHRCLSVVSWDATSPGHCCLEKRSNLTPFNPCCPSVWED